MAILQVIGDRERDLGGFVGRRLQGGPFVLIDDLGRAVFPPGHGMDVVARSHNAIARVSNLFSGSLKHRDRLGNIRKNLPGKTEFILLPRQ